MLIDTHAHLHFKDFNKDRPEVISRAKQAGVSAIIEVGVDFFTNARVLSLCNEHSGYLFPALGLHPTDIKGDADAEVLRVGAQIQENRPKLVALGEIGLDFYHEKGEAARNRQKAVFSQMLAIAERESLPVIIHSRDAEQECMDMLKSTSVRSVVMHCFSGSPLKAKACAEAGWFVSIPTVVCFSKEKQELAKAIPLEKMLLETDCPFLSPFRSQRNEPAFLKQSVEALSQALNKPNEDISSATTQNARAVFGLK